MEYTCRRGVEAPDVKPAPLPERIIDIHNHLEPSGDPEALIALMDESNIETTLVMGMFECPNEHVLAAIASHPGRLVGGRGDLPYLDPAAAADYEIRECAAGVHADFDILRHRRAIKSPGSSSPPLP